MIQESRFRKGKEIAMLAMREIGASLAALNLYPLGLMQPREEGAPHHLIDVINPRPILLVHGIVHNQSAFFSLKQHFDALSWKNIFTINYSTRHGSMTQMVDQLAQRVEEILESTQTNQIDIVAHSLGGLVSRYYMSVGGGRGKVKRLITLGTPHKGTSLSFLLRGLTISGLTDDLRQGSYLMNLLNETTLPRGTKIISIYPSFDWAVWPTTNSKVDGLPRTAFKNYEIEGVSHMGLLFSNKVADLIVNAIGAEDR